MVDCPSNGSSFLIFHSKEHVEFTKMILYMADPLILTVWSGCHIDEIYLYTLEKTCYYNGLQRAFGLAVGLSMADLT